MFNTQYHAKQILLNIALVDYFRDFNQTQTNSHMRAYRYEKHGSRANRAFADVRGPQFREKIFFQSISEIGPYKCGSRVVPGKRSQGEPWQSAKNVKKSQKTPKNWVFLSFYCQFNVLQCEYWTVSPYFPYEMHLFSHIFNIFFT